MYPAFQVVISTCGAAGSLLNMMYATDGQHTKYRGDLLPFDVVIIDEASQGSEAEVIDSLIPSITHKLVILTWFQTDHCPSQPMPAWWAHGSLGRSKPIRTHHQISYSQVTFEIYPLSKPLAWSSLWNSLKGCAGLKACCRCKSDFFAHRCT